MNRCKRLVYVGVIACLIGGMSGCKGRGAADSTPIVMGSQQDNEQGKDNKNNNENDVDKENGVDKENDVNNSEKEKIPGYVKYLAAASVAPVGVRVDDWENYKKYMEQNQVEEGFLEAVKQFSNNSSAVLLTQGDENASYSPLSLYLALSILADGAEGQTRDEIFQMMGLEEKDRVYLSEQIGKLYRSYYKNENDVILKFANSVWVQKNYPFTDKYIQEVQQNYYADLFRVDYQEKEIPDIMSEWVSDKTNGLIKPSIELSDNVVMNIINTIYLKAGFIEKFPEELTKQDTFIKEDGTKLSCDFMNNTLEGYRYLKGDGFVAVKLYLNEIGSMVFVLPDEGVKVSDLAGDAAKYAQMFADTGYEKANVVLSIPKLDVSSSMKLKDALVSLGMKTAFNENDADFSHMTSEQIYVSSAAQDVHMKIKEDGIEAAAFTMFGMDAKGIDEPEELKTVEIKLDRPFIYGVLSEDEVPIFTGVCKDPTQN